MHPLKEKETSRGPFTHSRVTQTKIQSEGDPTFLDIMPLHI